MAKERTSPFRMWTYYRDKHGYRDAVKEFYGDMIESDRVIGTLYGQLMAAEIGLDAYFAHLEDKEEEEKDNICPVGGKKHVPGCGCY